MSVDFNNRTFTCKGVTVSAELFEHFADRANEGTLFRFVKNDNGYITIELAEASR